MKRQFKTTLTAILLSSLVNISYGQATNSDNSAASEMQNSFIDNQDQTEVFEAKYEAEISIIQQNAQAKIDALNLLAEKEIIAIELQAQKVINKLGKKAMVAICNKNIDRRASQIELKYGLMINRIELAFAEKIREEENFCGQQISNLENIAI